MKENKENKPQNKDVDIEGLNSYIFDINDEPTIYTLECYDNKKRPVEKQMRVSIEPLSAKESNEITKEAYAATGQRNKMSEEEWTGKYSTHFTRINFAKKIKTIENIYFRDKEGVTKEITDPLELWTLKDKKASTIVTEIQALMNSQDEVSEEEEKN